MSNPKNTSPIVTREEYINTCIELVGSLEEHNAIKTTLFRVLHDACCQQLKPISTSTLLPDDMYSIWQLWELVNKIEELRQRDRNPN